MEFDTKEAAGDYAKEINSHTMANVHYYVIEKETEPGVIRKRAAQLEKQKERKKQKKN